MLQGAHLSTRLVTLNEWLGNESDTNWNAIVDQETGIFSRKFCRAFFPEAIDEAPTFASLATTLYREMSECIHGNIPKRIPLPDELAFHEATFLLWHDKAQALRLIANFALTIRYLVELDEEQKRGLEPVIMDQLGHIEVVRTFFGGPSTK